jgi:hypothetical protein
MEKAMQLDEAARQPGSQLLYGYFYSRNQLKRCDRYRQMLSQAARERKLAAAERSKLKRHGALRPHGLPATKLLLWFAALSDQKGVKRAWVARTEVRHLRSVPAYALAVEFGTLSWVSSSTLQQIANALPEGVSCVVLNKATKRGAWRQIANVKGSLIFARSGA